MNVGLRPTVRCHFDSAENILRVIMVEQATTDEKDPKEDGIMIYALKVRQHRTHSCIEFLRPALLPRPTQPGRAQKADFQSFAKTLCDHDGLKSRVVTSSAASVSGDAAAP